MTQTEDTTIVRSRQPLTAAELRSHLIQIESGYGDNKKKSDYLPMQGRILWFHGEVSRYTISDSMVSLDYFAEFSKEKFVWDAAERKSKKVIVSDKGVAIFKATVYIFNEKTGDLQVKTPGHKMETKVDFSDYVEKAETGAIGRALALAGYGTKFALELREDERLLDSPVEHTSHTTGNNRDRKPAVTGDSNVATVSDDTSTMPITDQQLSSIRKLSQHLGKGEPEDIASMSYSSAKELLARLSQEYRQRRSHVRAS